MLAVTRPWVVRAAVEGRSEPPFDRLHDPLGHSILLRDALAQEAFETSWRDDAQLTRLTRKRAPLGPALAAALQQAHQRLGAPAASLEALAKLARGEAVCTVAGQQPAVLGGPLFSLHKVAAAVGLARRVTARTGVSCVPVFWNHVEDSDFDEIRTVTNANVGLELADFQLGTELHAEGGLVGDLPIGPLKRVSEEAIARWSGLAGHAAVLQLARNGWARARDLGEAHAALMLELFGTQGLVVVDPRMPEFRAAARPVITRYLQRHSELGGAARSAGSKLEARLGRAPLSEAALESFVFVLRDGRRHKIGPDEAKALPGETVLIPSVALRPVVQDHVLPTVAMACGPGELAYLAQLRGVFEGLEVRAACPVPRFGATWLPPAAIELLGATEADPWSLVAGTDRVLRQHAEARVPPALRRDLADMRSDLTARLEAFAGASTALDPSLPQMVESARTKIDFQIARLLEGLAGKARHRMEREHPEWLRLRYYLLPGDKLQERRLAALEPVAYRGPAMIQELCDLAEKHAREFEGGHHFHYLLEL